jgi:hypothetical protein
MRELSIPVAKRILPVFLLCLISITAVAQKPPSVQQASLRIPANLKIDGKATEWNNKFQAYNRHTEFYYTLANNDNNLYLIVQATIPDVIRRILNGGISLTIIKSGKKGDQEGPCITYPVVERSNRVGVNFRNMPEIKPDVPATLMAADSAMNAINRSMATKTKLIMVTGIKNLDTLISIYNADGIKVAALFDNKLVYTLELSVALKQLDLSVNNPVKFAYHIMINEVAPNYVNPTNDGSIINSQLAARAAKMSGGAPPKRPDAGQAATDFWGGYTLAK